MADLREALVEAIDRYVAAKVDELVKARLADTTSQDLVAHDRCGLPRRAALDACRSGAVQGVRKVGSKWLATRAAWDAYISSRTTRTAEPAAANDDSADLPALAVARRLGAGR